MRSLAALFLTVLFPFAAAFAALNDAQEERAEALFNELRCVVCQNQSIADSEAGVAQDLRAIVRDQIAAGRSDGEILDFLVARYGEFVLLSPPLDWRTILLWGAPFILLVAGGFIIWPGRRDTGDLKTMELNAEEEARLKKLLERE
jgi:cytochrome c-type biogenesis protein CcmH